MNEQKNDMNATLVFFQKDNKILLTEKQKKIGAGCLNGFGGKVEAGETVLETAIREPKEEIGLTPVSLTKRSEIMFCNSSFGKGSDMCVHVFIATEWEGDIHETLEMRNPQWYSLEKIPYEKLMSSDGFWLSRIFAGSKIKGKIYFNDRQQVATVRSEIVEVSEFES